jgi:hypothetical protein
VSKPRERKLVHRYPSTTGWLAAIFLVVLIDLIHALLAH